MLIVELSNDTNSPLFPIAARNVCSLMKNVKRLYHYVFLYFVHALIIYNLIDLKKVCFFFFKVCDRHRFGNKMFGIGQRKCMFAFDFY